LNLVQFILSTCNTDIDTVVRCINKASFIYYDKEVCLISDDRFIYYFSKGPGVPTRKAYKVRSNFKEKMLNKLFYSKNIRMFKNHCKFTGKVAKDGSKEYLWA